MKKAKKVVQQRLSMKLLREWAVNYSLVKEEGRAKAYFILRDFLNEIEGKLKSPSSL